MCVECGGGHVRLRSTPGLLDVATIDEMRERVQLWTLVWLVATTLGDGGRRAADARQLRVARGLFTFIQPGDVAFSRSTAATHCKVSVDLTDLTTLRVGTVHPHVRTISLFAYVPVLSATFVSILVTVILMCKSPVFQVFTKAASIPDKCSRIQVLSYVLYSGPDLGGPGGHGPGPPTSRAPQK